MTELADQLTQCLCQCCSAIMISSIGLYRTSLGWCSYLWHMNWAKTYVQIIIIQDRIEPTWTKPLLKSISQFQDVQDGIGVWSKWDLMITAIRFQIKIPGCLAAIWYSKHWFLLSIARLSNTTKDAEIGIDPMAWWIHWHAVRETLSLSISRSHETEKEIPQKLNGNSFWISILIH